jgi:cell wall-associated NlpC family hydrolase
MIDTDDIIGVPWIEGGRDPSSGLDCLGVVLLVLERMGLPSFDPWAVWADAWRRGWRQIEQAVPDGWSRLSDGALLRPGDVVITQSEGHPTHVVIVVEDRRVVSAMKGRGVVLLPQRWAEAHKHSAWRAEA